MTLENFDPGPLAPADAEAAADGRWTLVFTRDLRHPPEKVWAALTEPDRVSRWAPFTTDRDLGQVGDATLRMIDGDTAVDVTGSVLRADRPERLEYLWGGDLLRWDLEPTGTGTRLVLRHTVADQGMVAPIAAGWHLCLRVAERLLDGAPIPPIRGADARNHGWDDLRDGYAAKLGIPPSDPPGR